MEKEYLGKKLLNRVKSCQKWSKAFQKGTKVFKKG